MNVLWVLDLSRNLLSIATITGWNLHVHFDKKYMAIINNKNDVVAKGDKRNNIYKLLTSTTQAYVDVSILWHG